MNKRAHDIHYALGGLVYRFGQLVGDAGMAAHNADYGIGASQTTGHIAAIRDLLTDLETAVAAVAQPEAEAA